MWLPKRLLALISRIQQLVQTLMDIESCVGELAGIAVGATVMLNNLVAGTSPCASGNYRSLWVYLVAPTLGAISGAAVYTGVKLNDNVSDPPRQLWKLV
ncbi:hypothetical protein F2Q68_00026471 [Brassica cretica]|uniref:Nodulin-like domain-containing protein n=1 Tax=Brassica cretica TaxID=69181 RepID=A0A8S9IL96_BRACR|nr:hypothetical protein F2Q68_00026471 [Brassica cretica]